MPNPRRDIPLTHFTDGDDVILIASNYAGERHPACYHNLHAHPECELHIGPHGADSWPERSMVPTVSAYTGWPACSHIRPPCARRPQDIRAGSHSANRRVARGGHRSCARSTSVTSMGGRAEVPSMNFGSQCQYHRPSRRRRFVRSPSRSVGRRRWGLYSWIMSATSSSESNPDSIRSFMKWCIRDAPEASMLGTMSTCTTARTVPGESSPARGIMTSVTHADAGDAR